MIKIKKGAKYLVTGGSGFLGGALIDRILNEGGSVVTIARNEGNLIKLKQKYNPTVNQNQVETKTFTFDESLLFSSNKQVMDL